MCPDNDNGAFYDPGQNGSGSGTRHSHPGSAKLPEDQNVIPGQIHHHGHYPGQHRKQGLTCLPQRTGIDLHHYKGYDLQQDHPQIFFSEQKGLFKIAALSIRQIQPDQAFPGGKQDSQCHSCDKDSHYDLKPEGIPHSLMVSMTIELCPKYARS